MKKVHPSTKQKKYLLGIVFLRNLSKKERTLTHINKQKKNLAIFLLVYEKLFCEEEEDIKTFLDLYIARKKKLLEFEKPL